MQVNMETLSPMMQQYFSIKEKHRDHILFFRLGDFYEMFYDDAIVASRELELTLTGRDCGQQERAPMCGVPYHACDAYISRLIKKGFKVAICEQVENPAEAKGVVRREVVRVVTPGTLIESSMLDEDSNNYISCILSDESGWGLASADISTGQVYVSEFESAAVGELLSELARYAPSEIIFNDGLLDKTQVTSFIKEKLHCVADLCDGEKFAPETAAKLTTRHFGKSLCELGLDGRLLSTRAVGALLAYLYDTQRKGLERVTELSCVDAGEYMALDLTARRNLELVRTMRGGEKKGSLLWVLDKTKTAMGKRLMRDWLEKPLMNPALISRRQNAVEELVNDTMLRCDVQELLSGVFDLERLMTRIIYGSASPREYKALEFAARALPQLRERIANCNAGSLVEIHRRLDPLEDICSLIGRALVDEPPAALKDGGVIREGYDAKLDETRVLVHDAKRILMEIEAGEKEKTGIKNLKIGFNRVFGYYIEVSKSNVELVPEHYIRRQTLTNGERFITPELKELEEKLLTANERIAQMEAALFDSVRRAVSAELHRVQATAEAVAHLDVFCSLAAVAVSNGYCRPEVDFSDVIEIRDGRHPVIEQMGGGMPFVANDTHLDNGVRQIAIITGPNMAGKSTYMRQTALIALMAQIGSFVPAASARIGVVDGIYTRVGASDDLAAGQSTFMVEMTEVAQILKSATSKSLLILDEIGRGTSTFDGMSIARAVVEYIADGKRCGAKTLFATHYHELTDLEEALANVKNYNIACKKRGDEITFLRRIVPGGADESYGIEVSKLAGVPEWIIKRARQVLVQLEEGRTVRTEKVAEKPRDEGQISFAATPSMAEQALRALDVNTLTPIEALNKLYELKGMVRE